MDLDEIVRRFGELCALPADEAEKQRELCAAAMAQVEEERNGLPGGEVEASLHTRLCVAETVIVGKVPDTYLQLGQQ